MPQVLEGGIALDSQKGDQKISNFTTRDLELGRTELHQACEDEEVWIARACIAFNDDDVNVPDDQGYTPMHLACDNGPVDMAKLLLFSGANSSLYLKPVRIN